MELFELWKQAPLWKQMVFPFAPFILLALLAVGEKICERLEK